MSRLIVLVVAALAATSCVASDIAPTEICDEVGFALSNRAFACTGDAQVGNAVFHEFEATYDCRVTGWAGDEVTRTYQLTGGGTQDVEAAYLCPQTIRMVACSAAKADDLQAVLAVTWGACGNLVARKP